MNVDFRSNRPFSRSPSAFLTLFSMALLFMAYAVLRWSNEAPALERARHVSDTPAYMRIARLPLSDLDFWLNARPFIFPLVIKAFGGNQPAVASFQAAFSILSWGLLALAVASWLQNPALRLLTFGLLLTFSLEPHIAGWDLVMLTESLSLSLMALFIAAWLWLLKGWRRWKVAALLLVAFGWAFCRDTNAWLLLMLAGLLSLAVLFFGANRRFLALALAFALLFALSNFAANKGQRWVFPFQNVLAERILTDAQALTFFSDCGMPLTPELLQLVDGHAGSAERAFYEDPALESYRLWLYADGKSCYVRWLLSVPQQSLSQPLADFETLVKFERAERFFPQRYQSILPWRLAAVLYPRQALLWLWALTSVAALVVLAWRAWKTNPAWMVFLALSLLIYPHLFIVWHGDTSGMDRHALSLAVQFILSCWLLALLGADAIAQALSYKHKNSAGS